MATKSRPAKAVPALDQGVPAFDARLRSLFVCAFSIACFLLNYAADGMRPGANYALGWYGSWFDQSKYFDMVKAIPHGSLGQFLYPPVYPLLGSLGALVYGRDPFLLVDLALFAIYVYCAFRILGRFLSPVLALVGSCVLVQASVDMFVTPWTSTVSAAALMVLVDLFSAGRYTWRRGVLAGVCAGLMFGARVGDVIPAAFVAFAIFFDREAAPASIKRFAVSAIAAAVVVAGGVITINLTFDGRVFGDYYGAIMRQGFNFIAIPIKMYGYLIDPFLFHRESHPTTHPIVFRLPMLLLTPVGIALMLRRSKAQVARCGLPMFLAIAGWCVVYVPFIAVTGLTLRQGSGHYLKPLLPILIGFALYAVARLTERISDPEELGACRRTAAYWTAAVLVLLLGIRLIPFHKLDLSQASISGPINSAQLGNMLDGDTSTRWDTGAAQRPGMEFDIDFKRPRIVQRIVLDNSLSPNDWPRKLTVWQSPDGKDWKPWWSTDQSTDQKLTDLRTDPRPVRWLKFKLDAGDESYYWSVHEFSVYGW